MREDAGIVPGVAGVVVGDASEVEVYRIGDIAAAGMQSRVATASGAAASPTSGSGEPQAGTSPSPASLAADRALDCAGLSRSTVSLPTSSRRTSRLQRVSAPVDATRRLLTTDQRSASQLTTQSQRKHPRAQACRPCHQCWCA